LGAFDNGRVAMSFIDGRQHPAYCRRLHMLSTLFIQASRPVPQVAGFDFVVLYGEPAA